MSMNLSEDADQSKDEGTVWNMTCTYVKKVNSEMIASSFFLGKEGKMNIYFKLALLWVVASCWLLQLKLKLTGIGARSVSSLKIDLKFLAERVPTQSKIN